MATSRSRFRSAGRAKFAASAFAALSLAALTPRASSGAEARRRARTGDFQAAAAQARARADDRRDHAGRSHDATLHLRRRFDDGARGRHAVSSQGDGVHRARGAEARPAPRRRQRDVFPESSGLRSLRCRRKTSITVDGKSFAAGTDFVPRDNSLFGGTVRPIDNTQVIFGGTLTLPVDTTKLVAPAAAEGKFVVMAVGNGPDGKPLIAGIPAAAHGLLPQVGGGRRRRARGLRAGPAQGAAGALGRTRRHAARRRGAGHAAGIHVRHACDGRRARRRIARQSQTRGARGNDPRRDHLRLDARAGAQRGRRSSREAIPSSPASTSRSARTTTTSASTTRRWTTIRSARSTRWSVRRARTIATGRRRPRSRRKSGRFSTAFARRIRRVSTRSTTAPTTTARARSPRWRSPKRSRAARRSRSGRSSSSGTPGKRRGSGDRSTSPTIRPCRATRSSRSSTWT